MQFSSKQQSLLLFIISAHFLSSAEIFHCTLNDQIHDGLCRQCEEGYVLDQIGISCLLQTAFTTASNCLQISNSGECMRCDCGYAFSIQLGSCVIVVDSLIGCEVFREGNICLRPKIEFLLLKEGGENGSYVSLQYSHDSFCEIYDLSIDRCAQCHSGFILDKSNQCSIFPHKIINEFFSYFSSDGDLQSRSIQFIAWSNKGVFEKIPFCAEHEMASNNLDQPILHCKECQQNKSVNKSKTACLPSPFDHCRVVSDEDHSFCEECVDNDHFYLVTDSEEFKQQRQICLPRQTYQLDPTSRCLEYLSDSYFCRKCQKGLFLTHYGCSLDKSMGRNIEIVDKNTSFYLKFLLRDPNCDLWLSERVCGKCKQKMIVDIYGNCQVNHIDNCMVQDYQGDCAQCHANFYYDANENICKQQTINNNCVIPSRSSDKCEECISNNYPDELGVCVHLDRNCAYSLGRVRKCEQCQNLFYLSELFDCVPLTKLKNCLISNGISDTCLKCQRNNSLSKNGECIPQILISDGVCSDSRYYLDKETNSCKEYTFGNVNLCKRFHLFYNECLECYYGSYLLQNEGCQQIENCKGSDGINNWCYYSISPSGYIDDKGQAQLMEENCITNRIDKKCLNCIIENEEHFDYLDPEILKIIPQYCTPQEMILNKEIINNCAQVVLASQNVEQESITAATAIYRCESCRNLYFLNENGICTPITDSTCMVSNGISNQCSFCYPDNRFNQTSNLCEETPQKPILFCETMKGQICIKCKNLYYTIFYQCWPISDPDCIKSTGVHDKCQKCKNGLILEPNFSYFFQNLSCLQLVLIKEEIQLVNMRNNQGIDQLGVIDDSDALNNKKINNNHESMKNEEHDNEILRIPQYSKYATLILEGQYCEKFNENLLTCEKCKEGFHFYPQKSSLNRQCQQQFILHCFLMNDLKTECHKCEDGYFLIQNGHQCLKAKNCLEFKDVCVKCSENTFLIKGQCIKLDHCKEHNNEVCFQCESGYFLSQLLSGGQENQQPKEGINFHETKNQLLTDISFPSQECIKIPNCIENDGVSVLCRKCTEGFELIQNTCVRIQKAQEQDSCQELHRNIESNQLECVKCRNLYYLIGSSCFSIIDTNQYCQKNDGVRKDCELCSFSGFLVTKEGDCKQLENCEISNGINWCVLCKDQYVVDREGNCILIEKEILHCEIYQLLISKYNNQMEKSNSSSTPLQNTGILDINSLETSNVLYVSEFSGCQKCSSLYYSNKETDFQECFLLNPRESTHCALSNGKTNSCSVCYSGYLLRTNLYGQISCSLGRISLKLSNIGCELFNPEKGCIKCYENFILGENYNCYPRETEQKCSKFNPTKDECLVCSSGYKPKKIKEQTSRETTICMRLEASEQVDNCLEYYPNTNKCFKCIKYFTQDIVEYFLNEQENLCQDVLYLMCKIISTNGKACAQKFIQNCEKYESKRESSSDDTNDLGCLECKNGYYLEMTGNYTICLPHTLISNCQIYSQTIPNTCELCDTMFFLKERDICLPISSQSCLIGDKNNNRCLVCLDRFGLDIDTGNCMEINIPNCEQFQVSSITTQNISKMCRKCRENYYFSEKQNECRLRLRTFNCQRFNSESECIECKEGFLLLSVLGNPRGCVNIVSSCFRSAKNCLKYDLEKSNSERIVCEKCKPNFIIDENLQCSPTVQTLTDKDNTPQPSIINNQGSDEKSIVEKIVFLILVGLIVAIGLVKLIVVLKKRFKKDKDRNKQMQEENNRYFEETNCEIQMVQPMQQIDNQSDITQITSSENKNKGEVDNKDDNDLHSFDI